MTDNSKKGHSTALNKSNTKESSGLKATLFAIVQWFLTKVALVEEKDDFIQTLRKMTTTFLIFCSPYVLAYAGYWIHLMQNETGVTASMLMTTLNLIFVQIVGIISFVVLRFRGTVSDIHQEVFMWYCVFFVLICTITVPEYDVRAVGYIFALVTSLAGTPSALLQILVLYLISWISIINDSFWVGREATIEPSSFTFLTTPGARRGPAIEKLLGLASGVTMCYTVILVVKMQSSLNVSFLRKSRETNVLAGQVVDLLRRYDTATVTALLDDAEEDPEKKEAIDADFLSSFRAMNANLETYRPFLPNYLFLSSEHEGEDGEEDDDDEGALDLKPSPSGSVASMTLKRSNTKSESGEQLDSSFMSSGGGSPLRGSKSAALAKRNENRRATFQASNYDSESATSKGSHYRSQKKKTVAAPAAINNSRGPEAVVKVSMALLHIKPDLEVWRGVTGFNEQSMSTASQLSAFVDCMYKVATETRASVHSMLGDTVQLTWNATNPVVQSETKAVQFLARLKERSAALSPCSFPIAGAVVSGRGRVFALTSAVTRQNSLLIDAPWLACLTAAFQLAQSHGAIVADELTQKAASFHCDFCAVDAAFFDTPDGFTFAVPGDDARKKNTSAAAEDALQHVTPACECRLGCDLTGPGFTELVAQAASSNKKTRILYEILGEKQVNEEEEWMYQLQQDQYTPGEGGSAGKEGGEKRSLSQTLEEIVGLFLEGKGDNVSTLQEILQRGELLHNDHNTDGGVVKLNFSPAETTSDDDKKKQHRPRNELLTALKRRFLEYCCHQLQLNLVVKK